MMNTERLAVGIQGLGIGEASYQGAVAYARERLQGRALTGPKSPEKPADSLLVHPDVRRMLLTQRAYVKVIVHWPVGSRQKWIMPIVTLIQVGVRKRKILSP